MPSKRTNPSSSTHRINDVITVAYLVGAYIAFEVFFNTDNAIVCQ